MTTTTRPTKSAEATLRAARGYLVASAAALLADLGVTMVLGQWLAPAAAAAVGFTFGTVVSYLLAKRLAFSSPDSAREFVGYALVGLLTLGVCVGLVHLLTGRVHWSLLAAKIATIPVSFVLGFVLRRKLTQTLATAAPRALPLAAASRPAG